MQDTDEQDAAQTIIRNNCHQVVDRGDQRTGSHCRIHMDLFEKKRDTGSHCSGNDHRQNQGKTDTGRYRIRKTKWFSFKQCNVKTDEQERKDSQDQTIGETDAHFLPYQFQLLSPGQGLIHQHTDGNSQRLGTHVTCHVKDQGLETHNDRK